MKLIAILFSLLVFYSCNDQQPPANPADDSTAVINVNPGEDWKFGIALWTFHNMNFAESVDRVNSSGLKYIEPNTFHKAGP
ncbi:MAG: sugar phosphate isomerase/epimerase, partial [Chitinophagaceae bacterium]